MLAPRILVGFHGSEGQTAKIAEHVGDILALHGAIADVVDADADPPPDGYDGIVVGDLIHTGHHSESVVRYLKRHAPSVAGLPSALFQVSLTSVKRDAEHTAAAEDLVRALCEETGFAPNEVAMFAGALASTRYGSLTRRVLSSISAKEGGSTDGSTDHEYTDWAEVEHFASRFFALVAAHRRPSAPHGVSS